MTSAFRANGFGRFATFLVLLLALSLVVSSCTSRQKRERQLKRIQPCPAVAIVSGTGTITIFQGEGRDADDVAYRGEISNLRVSCEESRDVIEANISFHIVAVRGPAGRTDSVSLPFFVAVTAGNDEVLSKKIYNETMTFTANSYRSAMREQFSHELPIGAGREVEFYEILVGFQLSDEQLEYNFLH